MTKREKPGRPGPNIVVIGGGTGSFAVLQALKRVTKHITALVSMADDGGSTGVLRDEHGTLPSGDVRQCLVALSNSPDLRELFKYRFESGSMEGHSFGNLFLTALEKTTGNFGEAVKTAGQLLNITGRVVPITLDNVRLVLHARGGFTVRGEGKIDVLHFDDTQKKPRLSLEPTAAINPEARQAILDADIVLVAPGDIYTSLGALLVVDGVAEALRQTPATVVYLCNLVVKPGQTDGMTVADHASEIERFAGGPILDYVLYNTATPPEEAMRPYLRSQEFLVKVDPPEVFSPLHYQAVGYPLVDAKPVEPSRHDKLAKHRSFVRHDPDAVVSALERLFEI